MAYVSQEMKSELAPTIKSILKKYGMKGSLAVRNHSTIVLNLKSGKIDFGGDNIDVNPYWFHEHFEGKAKKFLTEAFAALNHVNVYAPSDIVQGQILLFNRRRQQWQSRGFVRGDAHFFANVVTSQLL